mgnify:CR=1 FL=1
MTKRMKRIAALLTCGLVLASGTSVYAGNAEGTLLGYPISLEVSVRKSVCDDGWKLSENNYLSLSLCYRWKCKPTDSNDSGFWGAVRRAFMLLMDGILERQKVCMKNGGVKAYLVAYP